MAGDQVVPAAQSSPI
uniref:Ubiquitin specific peptidase 1 n=1 Tax=Ictidomys tridecemlineatus TaxID=43179 RepID=A0A287CW38_ICTTR